MDEDKKIDLDAPLLSIRRFSVQPPTSTSNSNSTKQAHKRSSLPFYKPDIKSGPVRNPGVIPFVWEQRPGQPKSGTNSPCRPPFVAPRPPPVKMGSSVRTRKPVPNYSSSAKEMKDPYFEDSEHSNNERLEEKREQVKENEKFDKPPQVVPESIQAKLGSAIRNGNHHTQETEKEKQTKEQEGEESKKQEQEQEQEQKQKEMPEQFEEEEEEDNFSDALDTLSRTESFFMNCSVSGLSELPAGPTKQSPYPGGSDPDAREFMIDRFLPAAQAVAIGSPQYASRKAPVPARELAKPTQAIVGTGINPSQRRVPVPLPYQNQPKYENSFDEEHEDEEDDDDDDDDDDEEEFEESRRFYAKGCGFLPSFCMKSSFLMMNPVPGMKARDKVPPRGGAGRRTGSTLIRSSNNGSDSKHSDEALENYMHSWEPVYKHKQDQTSNSSMKINDSSKNINSETSRLTYWSDSQNTGGGSSPLIHSTREVISPPFHASNDRSSKDSRLNSFEKIYYKSSPAVASHCSSQKKSNSLDRDLDRFLDAQESNPSEAASATEDVENVVEVHEVSSIAMQVHNTEEREYAVKKNGVDRVLPVHLLPLPLPKSPTESWLSRTLPSVPAKKQPVSSFLGMQVQNKKQGLLVNERKPSGPRQIRFSEVLERPASAQSEI